MFRMRFTPALRVGVLGALTTVAALAVSAAFAAPSPMGAPKPARPSRATEWPLTVAYFSTVPGRPRAGQSFLAGVIVMDEETGEPLDSATVRCRGRIGSRLVHLISRQFVANTGTAFCYWKIPAQTGGKRFFGRIQVFDDYGDVATKKFSRIIRP